MEVRAKNIRVGDLIPADLHEDGPVLLEVTSIEESPYSRMVVLVFGALNADIWVEPGQMVPVGVAQ